MMTSMRDPGCFELLAQVVDSMGVSTATAARQAIVTRLTDQSQGT
jgi:hypothetical protein